MTEAIGIEPPQGRPAVAVRLFGWLVVAALAAFILNSWLSFVAGFPGAAAAFAGGNGRAWLQLLLYPFTGAVAVAYVLATRRLSLRRDAARLTALVLWLVRCGFWAVFLVGIVDAAISFLRVEGFLESVVGAELATELGRPHYRGAVVHVPLLILGLVVGTFTRTLGFPWLALLVVVAELTIVFTRFVFSYEQAFMGDLVRFWYAALFLFSSAYTLLDEGHVRVDVLYAGMRDTTRGAVNAIGSVLLGMTFCWTILLVGFANKSAVIASPLFNFEISQSGFGMYVKYLMAGFLAFFAVTMLLQFVAYLFESVADWRGEPGVRPHEAAHAA